MEDRLDRVRKSLVLVIGTLFILFHLYTAMFGVLDGLTQRNLHLTMMLLVVFLLKPSKLKYIGLVYDLVLMIATLAVGAYMHVASAEGQSQILCKGQMWCK